MFELAGRKIANTLDELIEPGRVALLLWDMEYGIAPHAFNYQQVLPNLQSLSATARRVGVPVFYLASTGKNTPGCDKKTYERLYKHQAIYCMLNHNQFH